MAAEKPFVIEYYYKTNGATRTIHHALSQNHYPVLKKGGAWAYVEVSA